jgi:pimeloyl-ACP methyl ester carboxylesterase
VRQAGSKLAHRRPSGVLALAWACLESAASGRTEHRPTSADWPDSVVRRTSFLAGGGHGWRVSALESPRETPAPWKFVVITGAPSWAEYWAPVIAALPPDREMVVVDRPGFAASEPADCVPDIRHQAEALAPLLKSAPGQRIVLIGQSYGAAIATLMAASEPGRVSALVLLSSYLDDPGPTARWLVGMGLKFLNVIPRDLRNAVIEVSGQGAQLGLMRQALPRLRMPVHVIHGDKDDFAPIETARRLAQETSARGTIRFQSVPAANHFLTDGPPDIVIAALEACLAPPRRTIRWRWPRWASAARTSVRGRYGTLSTPVRT